MDHKKLRTVAMSVLILAASLCPTVAIARNGDNIAAMRETSRAFSEVARKVVPAVVSIRVINTVQAAARYHSSPQEEEFFERFFGRKYQRRSQEPQTQEGQGSGFIISSNGYILTNNHVVGNADEITVILHDGRKFENVELIGTDPDTEIAVIKIDGDDLPVVELGNSDQLEIGEWVIAVGNPFGLSETVTVGVVSAKGRTVGITERGGYEDFIQTDAAINPGNSGGPLLDIDGKAIGINTAIFSQSGGYMGIGFAIPIGMATKVKDQLIKFGKVTRGFLGIRMDEVDHDTAEFFNLDKPRGVLVAEVVKDSPADKAGLKRHDIILELDGKTVNNLYQLRNSISLMEPGTRATLAIIRDGDEKNIRVKIGTLEKETPVAAKTPGKAQELGLRVENLTGEMAQRLGYDVEEGVIIIEVESDSPAGRAGILPGTLIVSVGSEDVTNVAQFNDALKTRQVKESGKVLLLLRNAEYIWYEPLHFDRE